MVPTHVFCMVFPHTFFILQTRSIMIFFIKNVYEKNTRKLYDRLKHGDLPTKSGGDLKLVVISYFYSDLYWVHYDLPILSGRRVVRLGRHIHQMKARDEADFSEASETVDR